MDYLIKQRDALNGYRRQYLEALGKNDFKEANDVQDEFKRQFPTFKQGIQVKPQDIRASAS